MMFRAKFLVPYSFEAPFTKGKTYDVVDFNDFYGTYIVVDDHGETKHVDWLRFEDQGRLSTVYQRG